MLLQCLNSNRPWRLLMHMRFYNGLLKQRLAVLVYVSTHGNNGITPFLAILSFFSFCNHEISCLARKGQKLSLRKPLFTLRWFSSISVVASTGKNYLATVVVHQLSLFSHYRLSYLDGSKLKCLHHCLMNCAQCRSVGLARVNRSIQLRESVHLTNWFQFLHRQSVSSNGSTDPLDRKLLDEWYRKSRTVREGW